MENSTAVAPPTLTGNENVTFPIERSSQVAVIATSVVFIVLPTVAVILRLISRRIARRVLGASDYCIIAACVSPFPAPKLEPDRTTDVC